MEKFVIAGIQRSGTTLVRTTINSHPDILCLGEVFFMRSGPKPAGGKRLERGFEASTDVGYRTYADRTPGRRLRHYVARRGLVRDYLDFIYQTPGYSAVGFKFMYGQLRKYPSVLPYIFDNNIHVINVVRENVFRVLLSHLTMRARGVAHSTKEARTVTVHVPTADLVAQLDRLEADGRRWQEVFADYPAYMKISYETFTQDKDSAAREILTFLNMDPDAALQSDLVKLNTAPLPEIVENFDEVQSCLAGTPFARHLIE